MDEVYAHLTKAKSEAENAAKDNAENARKIAAHSTLWMFVALLLGPFFASLMANLGGRQRDRVQVTS
ncbi:MAG: hypothetical protein H7240_13160 [Glaciimonas sp.]|nr:hypothetical protein [Glaciimonas sp.]